MDQLTIASYNIQGFRAATIPYLERLLQCHDIVLIQEHWLLESQFHLISDAFPQTISHCVSGMAEQVISYGRGYGGVAIIWRSSLACSVEPVRLRHKRVCGVKISFSCGMKLYLACVYLPCDGHFSDSDYTDALSDIFSSDACHEADCIIVGGDFNTDFTRVNSPHTRALKQLCNSESMTCITQHEKCDVDYTFESKANNTRSCIDHFIVSENLNDSVVKCITRHEGDNLSDHDPVCLYLSIDVDRFSADEQVFHSKPLWYKATSVQVKFYQYLLDFYLGSITISRELSSLALMLFALINHALTKSMCTIIKSYLHVSWQVNVSRGPPRAEDRAQWWDGTRL